MRSFWSGLAQPLFDSPLARRVLHTFHAASNRRLLARLDLVAAGRRQTQTLLALVHHARQTPFGRDHDFGRIRTPNDYRRLVPVRRQADFARLTPQPGCTWPATGPALLPGGDVRGLLTLSAWTQRAHRRTLSTALALIDAARTSAPLLSGAIFWLGDDTLLPGVAATRQRQLAAERFPLLVRPAVRSAPGWDCLDRLRLDAAVPSLVRHLARQSPTCLIGPAERMVAFSRQVQAARGEGRPERVWPELQAVIYSRRDPGFPVEALRRAVGPAPLLLEMLGRPEGPIALEDPRHHSLRLLIDTGVYFEFVPAARGGEVNPPRIGLDEVRPGLPYELVLTSPPGVWAVYAGLTVCFDRIDPPLVRVLTPAAPAALRSDAPAEAARVPHRPSAGTPAVPPETFFHTPWSAPADRG